MQTVSLCMIVKNEGSNLNRCLMAARPIVDEIIVVDTGSTDNTKEIAKQFGSRLFDFIWTNNFSDARNFSLSQATSQWILSLDADELISASDHVKFLNLVRQSEHRSTAFQFELRNYVTYPNVVGWIPNQGQYSAEETGTGWYPDEVRAVKLFPNMKDIHFIYSIYEDVIPSILKLGLKIKKTDIAIHHYGVLTDSLVNIKLERDLEIMRKDASLKKEQSLVDIIHIAKHLSLLGRYVEALQYWEQIVHRSDEIQDAHYYLGHTYFSLGRYRDALMVLRKEVSKHSPSNDAIVLYAQAELCAGDIETAVNCLEELLHREPLHALAMFPLAIAYFCTSRKIAAIELVDKLRNMNFGCAHYFSEFGKILISAGRINSAILLLQSAVESNNTNADTSVLLAQCYQQQMAK